ncbi:ImpA domain-containing protein [Salmonella enterica subsp. enterica serovar Montevideo]|nr:ImpA domain-containing protein [Salmonella enterica subsp. enterica serovar Montevideo]EEK7813549.1 ImpA domain-containing protein [Salmonella enterica subsp. enterica serovar Montevideo]
MSHTTERHLKTGNDPRTMPDYSAMRDEIAKLAHPARPDVDWAHVEKLALNLFDTNGVELQTAAWYTLARAQLAGLQGFNEGMAILDALIRYQWSAMWPASAHARIEILSSLNKRLQQLFRTLSLQREDLPGLNQSIRLLSSTGEALQRLELHNASGFESLRQMLQNATIRLENSDVISSQTESNLTDVALPVGAERQNTQRWVYVVNSEPAVEVIRKSASRITPLVAYFGGILTAAVLSTVTYIFMPIVFSHPGEEALNRSLAALPISMPLPAVDQLRQDAPAWLESGDTYAKQLTSRLNELSTLPPYWPLQYGNQLVEQTRHLYPNAKFTEKLSADWRSKLQANSLPNTTITGWYKGVSELQILQDRLNQLDEKKGKYLTVSELKTAVFSISKSLNESVPVEELIRQLQNSPQNQPRSRDLLNRADLQLRQLNNSYIMATSDNQN